MGLKPCFDNSGRPIGISYQWSRILRRLRPLDSRLIPRYATEIKWTNSLRGCDPYDPEIFKEQALRSRPPLLPYGASLRRLSSELKQGFALPLEPKELTRCSIRGNMAPLVLSVPVEGGNRALRTITNLEQALARVDSIALSEHGNWRHGHIAALRTVYSSAPFFIHYSEPVEEAIARSATLGELLRAVTAAILAPFSKEVLDQLEAIAKTDPSRLEALRRPLLEVSDPDLSALDALFRLGPDAIFLLFEPLI